MDYEDRMMQTRDRDASFRARSISEALARTNQRVAQEYLRGAWRRGQIEQAAADACSQPLRS
jgi:hypothetical protein